MFMLVLWAPTCTTCTSHTHSGEKFLWRPARQRVNDSSSETRHSRPGIVEYSKKKHMHYEKRGSSVDSGIQPLNFVKITSFRSKQSILYHCRSEGTPAGKFIMFNLFSLFVS